jgi:hypothetical protein
MFLESQYKDGSRSENRPETYELLESGWIDRASEFLGFGRWAIGRPNLSKSTEPLKHSSRGTLRSNAQRVIESHTSWSPVDGVELFLKHIPLPEDLRIGAPWQNSIEYRNILVIGEQGSGKTTIDEALAYALGARYHSPLRVCMAIQTAGIAVLIDVAARNAALAYMLVGSDLTLAKIPKEQVNRFFQVRHIIQDGTGVRRAIVVTSLESHTLFGVDKNLRTTFTMMFVKSVPTNPYDRSLLKRYIDPDLLNAFEHSHNADECLIWDAQYASHGALARVATPSTKMLVQVGHANAPWFVRMLPKYFKGGR